MRLNGKNRLLPAIALSLGFLTLLLMPHEAFSQQAGIIPGVTATPLNGGATNYSLPIQTLLFFTFLSFLPAIILMMTGFTRIVIVLSLLRMALGTQSSPPNQVIIGLALFMTFFVMAPTFEKVYEQAYVPFEKEEITFNQMVQTASEPMRKFMLAQTRESDLALFLRLNGQGKIEKRDEIDLKVLIPAFVTSELKTAFQIGFMIFLPFLIIDLVVSSVLMSMGMMMLSPMLISLPFKIMLFVLVDGWTLIVGSLIASFG